MNLKDYKDITRMIAQYISPDLSLNKRRDLFLKSIIQNDLKELPYTKQELSQVTDKLFNSILIYYDTNFISLQQTLYPSNPFIDPRGLNNPMFDMSNEGNMYFDINNLLGDELIQYSGIKFVDYYNKADNNSSLVAIGYHSNEIPNWIPSFNNEPKLVWEFVQSNNDFQVFLKPYYYCLISNSRLETLFNYLPRRTRWKYKDDGSISVDYIFPTEYNLIPIYSNNYIHTLTVLTKEMGHNLLPNFIFTGKVYFMGEVGEPYYEYSNINNNYSFPGDLYISPLKPPNLDFPLGIPKAEELEECLNDHIGYYPSDGDIDIDLGIYTGYITNNTYHSNITYYLYRRSDDSIFLSKYPPKRDVKWMVKDARRKMLLTIDPYLRDNSDIDIDINITSSNSPSSYKILLKEII